MSVRINNTSYVILDAEVDGRPGIGLRIDGGSIDEIGPNVRARPDEGVLRAGGGAVIAGLHDHHVHLRAAAAASDSVAVGPEAVGGVDGLRTAIRRAAAKRPIDTWVRAVGYHESVAGPIDRWTLDEIERSRPVRVQHRTGVLWVLNSHALGQLPIDAAPPGVVERDERDRPTGRLWRGDDWLSSVLADDVDRVRSLNAVLQVIARATAHGVVGFTDADPRRTSSDVDQLRVVTHRLHLMGPAELEFEQTDRLTLGPVKVLLDDHALPALDDLADRLIGAHALGRPVAVHCVTRTQLVLTVAAFNAAGSRAGDRVEHASVVPEELIPDLHRLGLTVVTQPSFVGRRGDVYLREVDADDQPHLYRVRSLLDAEVPVAFSSDMPYGDADPWETIAAATRRTTPSGRVVGPAERVDARTALAAFQGHAHAPTLLRRVERGAPADLCVLRAPLDAVLRDPHESAVRATIVDGALMSLRL